MVALCLAYYHLCREKSLARLARHRYYTIDPLSSNFGRKSIAPNPVIRSVQLFCSRVVGLMYRPFLLAHYEYIHAP